METKTMRPTFNEILNEKNHVVEFYVPPVKFMGIIIREGYTERKFIPCPQGESCRERMVKSLYRPNPIWKKLMENVNVKTN